MRPLVLSALLMIVLAQPALAAPPQLDWLDLLPPEDLKALEEMPEIVHDTPEGQGFSDQGALKQRDPGLPEVMYSTRTVAKLDGKSLRLGGYPVPLESDARGRSTLFFLVPYPGACIHVPPPPPNQIVLVRFPKGIELDDIYAPIWVEGKLRIELVNNDLADAAYALDARLVRPIEENEL